MYVQKVIVVFNRRLGADRRELYHPTRISSASYYESRSSSHSTDGAHQESLAYKLRIPIDASIQDGRTYVSEAAYKALSAEDSRQHWTLQKGDQVLMADAEPQEALDQTALTALARSLQADLITIKEYADNTVRGSDRVRHWRIGGE